MPYILKAQELETRANKVTVLDETVTDNQYPSAKAVRDALSQFTPSANPDTVVGQRTEDGGEIFNDYENNKAVGECSHAEGYSTEASGIASHAGGFITKAEGAGSHASGIYTRAGYEGQFVVGISNENKENTVFEVGCGDPFIVGERNALEVYKDGHAELPSIGKKNELYSEADPTAIGDSDFSITTKGYVDDKIVKATTFDVTINPENETYVSINNASTSENPFSVKLRKTYNLCNFDSGIIPNVTNRAYTNLLRFEDYTSVTVNNGYKAWCHVYNSKGSRVGNNGYWVTGPYTLPITALKSISSQATHFRLAIGKIDDSSFSGTDNALTLLINYKTYNGSGDTTSLEIPTLAQGTIDKGVVNTNIKTRLHINNMLPLADYLSGTITSGYKVWYHFYDKDKKYLGGSGQWLIGRNNTLTSTANKINSNAVYFNVVIGRTDEAEITPSSVPTDVFTLYSANTLPAVQSGTIDTSIVEQAINSVSGRDDVIATNNGDGTFTFNGTVQNKALTMQINLSTLAPAINTGASSYTVSIMTKSENETSYSPLNYSAYNASGGALTVNNGILNFAVSSINNVPGVILYTAPVGTLFNNTTFYAMLETGNTSHDWEECQVSELTHIEISIEDGNGNFKFYTPDESGVISGKCVGPYIGVANPKGTRVLEFTYSTNTKSYIDNHTPNIDLSEYYTAEDTEGRISQALKNYYTKADMNTILSNKIYVSTTAPTNPTAGMIWVTPLS